MNTFINPYKDAEKTCRLVSDVLERDFNFIYAIRPMKRGGTLQTTINLLWSKLTNELRKRGITNFSHVEQFEHFIANCELRLPGESVGGTSSGSMPVTADTNDGRTAPRVGEAHQNVTFQPSHLASTDRKSVRRHAGTKKG